MHRYVHQKELNHKQKLAWIASFVMLLMMALPLQDGTIPRRDARHTRPFCPRAARFANVNERKGPGLALLPKNLFNKCI